VHGVDLFLEVLLQLRLSLLDVCLQQLELLQCLIDRRADLGDGGRSGALPEMKNGSCECVSIVAPFQRIFIMILAARYESTHSVKWPEAVAIPAKVMMPEGGGRGT